MAGETCSVRVPSLSKKNGTWRKDQRDEVFKCFEDVQCPAGSELSGYFLCGDQGSWRQSGDANGLDVSVEQ